MIVGFDSDGVLDNFGEGVKSALEARGQGDVWKSGPTKKPFWNFYEDWGWDFEQFKDLVDWGVDNGYIFTGHWRPGAVETVRAVKRMGHQVVIITDRSWGTDPMNSQRNTIAAFEKAGIPYDKLLFSRDKTIEKTHIFVEDKIENYDAITAAGTECWLINRSWNEVGRDNRNRIQDVTQFPVRVAKCSVRLNYALS